MFLQANLVPRMPNEGLSPGVNGLNDSIVEIRTETELSQITHFMLTQP